MANLYFFIDWWVAGQQPLSVTDLLNMPAGMWEDFKYLLGKYGQLKKIVKWKNDRPGKRKRRTHEDD